MGLEIASSSSLQKVPFCPLLEWNCVEGSASYPSEDFEEQCLVGEDCSRLCRFAQVDGVLLVRSGVLWLLFLWGIGVVLPGPKFADRALPK